jgi:hypothetical protein
LRTRGPGGIAAMTLRQAQGRLSRRPVASIAPARRPQGHPRRVSLTENRESRPCASEITHGRERSRRGGGAGGSRGGGTPQPPQPKPYSMAFCALLSWC